jgi:hypothetical protein
MTAIEFPFRLSVALLAVAGASTLAGCSKSGTTPVEGVVLLDGQPLAGASIQFVPQDKGRDATGETDKNGHFAMSTFQPKDGAMPGAYKVVIAPPVGAVDSAQHVSAEEAMSATSKQPAKKSSATGTFPQKYSRPDQTPLTQDVPVRGKLKFELSSK